jgi:polar amino acid transport system permease protein
MLDIVYRNALTVLEYIMGILPAMFSGLVITLELFIVTIVLSIPFGLIIALARISKFSALRKATDGYIWLLRGTPLLLQLFFVYYGLPTFGIVLERFPAAIIAFVLNYAAYFAEIFRAGIQSIDKGQYEGAKVLGFTYWQTMWRIILPQVAKRVLPPVSNETITLVKDTALVYAIGLGELLRAAKIAVSRDAMTIPFVVAAVFYLVMTYVLTRLFHKLEMKYAVYE